MALRLPRLPVKQPDWPNFQRWWQSVVEAIERALDEALAARIEAASGASFEGGSSAQSEQLLAASAGDAGGAVGQFLLSSVPDASGTILAGAGLSGGGNMGANLTLAVGAGTGISVGADTVGLDTGNARNVDHSAVSVIAGDGLTGGGTIESNRTLNVVAGTGISVAADSVGIDTTVVPRLAVANTFTQNQTIGSGGTGGATPQIIMNGGSGSNGGPFIRFQKNGTTIGYAGSESALSGGTSNDLTVNSTAAFLVYANLGLRATFNSTGLDVVGLLRGDSFRIDQTPTAETVVCTHTITFSANGTNYKIPIVAA